MLLAPLLGGIGMLFGADKDTTSIICAFNGQGKIAHDAPVKEVKIEQKVAFNDHMSQILPTILLVNMIIKRLMLSMIERNLGGYHLVLL